MATTKVSALTAKNTLGGSEEILINDGGVSKKSTVAGITLAGEVTGAVTGVVIAANVVDEANLKVSNTPTNGYVLTAQSGNTGGLTWAQDSATDNTKLPLAGGAMTGAITTNSTFDGRDVAADGVTADAALPKAGGTMTGAILHSDGSTSAPSISFSADTNTGFYRVGSDKIGTVLGGSLKTTLTGTGLGIGTSSPTVNLHIKDSTSLQILEGGGNGYVDAALILKSIADTNYRGLGVFMHDAGGDTQWYAGTPYGSSDQYQIGRQGSLSDYNQSGSQVAYAFMTIKNSGNVGIGTASPVGKLHIETDTVNAGSGEVAIRMDVPAAYVSARNEIRSGVTSGTNPYMSFAVRETASPNATVERLRIDSSGTVGIGCVPSSIQSGFDTLQIGGNLTLNVDSTGAGAGVYMGNNVYRDSTNSRWEYIYTDEATQYLQANGTHIWRNAASGSANAAITWSESMRIDASGNVGIGTTSINSDAKFVVSNGGAQGFEVRADSNRIEHLHYNRTGSAYMPVRNNGLSFEWYLANSPKMTLNSSGNVGIGTSSPSAKIHATTATAGYAGKLINTNGASDANGLLIQAGTGSSEYALNVTNTAGSTNFMVVKGNGNVGIGTTAPSFETGTGLEIRYAGGNGAHLKLTDNASGAGGTNGFDLYAFNTSGYIENYEAGSLVFRNNGDERMRITSAGNVGIGTTSPDNLLHITSAGSDTTLIKLENTNADAYSARMTFVRSSSSVAVDDDIGKIDFYAKDSAGNSDRYALMRAKIKDKTSGSEDGALIFSTVVAGSNVDTMQVSGGRVGIGTASPTTQLDVTSSGNGEIAIISGTSGITSLYMGDSAQKDKGKIFYHNGSDYMAFNANGGEKLRIQTAGGISFNGDTAAANALDDYEEGTWTPVLTDLTNNATMHALTAGVYTKIGRLVTVTANVRTSSLGSVSGNLYVTGFPYTSANTDGNHGAGAVANAENMNITAGHAITLYVGKNGAKGRFDIYDTSQGITGLQSGEWSSDGMAAITATYSI